MIPSSMQSPLLMDSVEIRSPLGIIFRDTVTGDAIGSGLQVTAQKVGARWPDAGITKAHVNRSGVWVFRHLDGLRKSEMGGGFPEDSGSPLTHPQYRIEVQDLAGRFLPFSFVAELPEDGLFKWPPVPTQPFPWADVPLFSAPQRPVPPACAVIRSLLVRPDESAAAWALVEASVTVRSREIRAFGVTDSNGSLAIMFPWPELTGLYFSSPLDGANLAAQSWDVNFSAWGDFDSIVGNVADLDAILKRLGQPADHLLAGSSTPEEYFSANLTFGAELIVPEQSVAPGQKRELIISPAS